MGGSEESVAGFRPGEGQATGQLLRTKVASGNFPRVSGSTKSRWSVDRPANTCIAGVPRDRVENPASDARTAGQQGCCIQVQMSNRW